MKQKKIIEYWINSSDRDYEVMNSLFEKKHYVWTLFLGHLVLEKLLKALYVKQVGVAVPYTHDLTKIADLTNLNLTEEQKTFLMRLLPLILKPVILIIKTVLAKRQRRGLQKSILIK